MSTDWTALIFNAGGADFDALRALKCNQSVCYACYCTYNGNGFVFTVAFIRFTSPVVSPVSLLTTRAWLKPCTNAGDTIDYIQYCVNYVEYGDRDDECASVFSALNEIEFNVNKD